VIANLKPYPAMKRSGVPWLGEVPEHWAVRRLRDIAEMRVSSVDKHSLEQEVPVRLCNYVDVYKHDRIGTAMPFMRATATREEIERFHLMRGDVLITKDSETWNDIGVPALVEETAGDLVCGYHLALLRPFDNTVWGPYLFRELQSSPIAYQFHVEANGVTRYGLSHAAIKSIRLPLPPLSEQAAIVRFLDHADRRIRRYIRAKQKLIKLLEEQKQAIIHRAVTRGLDPNVCLKPSGVEWLGDVPEHWDVRKLRQCVSIMGGMTPSMETRRFWDGRIPWVTPKDMKRTPLSDSSVRVTEEAILETSLRLIEPPAVLMVVRGMILARKVPIAWTTAPVTVNQDMKALLPVPGIIAEYLAALLSAAQDAFVPLIDEAGHGTRRLPTERWRALGLALPPEREQREILQFLNEATDSLGRAIENAGRAMVLLRELRTRLIADVVTGKLDVREAAARLPDETEEPEPIEESDLPSDAGDEAEDDVEVLPERAEA